MHRVLLIYDSVRSGLLCGHVWVLLVSSLPFTIALPIRLSCSIHWEERTVQFPKLPVFMHNCTWCISLWEWVLQFICPGFRRGLYQDDLIFGFRVIQCGMCWYWLASWSTTVPCSRSTSNGRWREVIASAWIWSSNMETTLALLDS